MQQIKIEKGLCTSCGTCVSACSQSIIQKNRDDDYPVVVPGLLPYCSRCGHCEASCPEGQYLLVIPGRAGSRTIPERYPYRPVRSAPS